MRARYDRRSGPRPPQAAGLSLTAEADRLRWRGPQPPPELLAKLRAHKTELLRLLLTANDIRSRAEVPKSARG